MNPVIVEDNKAVETFLLAGKFLAKNPTGLDAGTYIIEVENINLDGVRTVYHRYTNLTALTYHEAAIRGANTGDTEFPGGGGGGDINLPEGGEDGDLLAKDDTDLVWRSVGSDPGDIVALDGLGRLPSADGSLLTNLPGGMSAPTYDPQEIEGDAFDLDLHTGVVSLSKGGTGVSAGDMAALRIAFGLEINADVQAHSAILDATTAAFTTEILANLGDVDIQQLRNDVDSLANGIVLIGLWDPTTDVFPGEGVAQPGNIWVASEAGEIDGVEFSQNDRLLALVPNASETTYGANWHKLSYTDQIVSVAGKTGVVVLEMADITDAGVLATLDTINNALWSGTDLAVEHGGTGASDAATARANLGLIIDTDIMSYSAILAGMEESFLTAHKDKLDLITVTGPIDLDSIDIAAIEQAIEDIETALDSISGIVSLAGTWDASAGTFPGGGSATAGQTWIVSDAGTVGGVTFAVNDQVVALIDSASETVYAANWFKQGFASGAVTSVAGRTGAVVLSASDISGLGALATKSTINNADWSGTVLAVTNGGTGGTSASSARTNLGLIINTDVMAYHAGLYALRLLTTTDNFVVGAGSGAFKSATASEARGYLDLGDISTLDKINGSNWLGTDLAVVDGGTGASTANNARTNLGLVIGTNVQAYSSKLAAIVAANVSANRILIADGTDWISKTVAEAKVILEIPTLTGTPAYLAGGQTLTGGFAVTPTDDGIKSTGTFTPTFAGNNYRYYINNGNHTLGVPTGSGSMVMRVTNGGTAGTINTAAYDFVSGADDLTTTVAHEFFFHILVIDGTSRLTVEALQ